MKEYLSIVDEKDTVIGKADWDELFAKNLLHRGTGVLIFNSKHELFVHQRAKTMMRNAGLYAVVVGGGVAVGESYEQNAVRELQEETGITGVTLKFLYKFLFRIPMNQCFISVFSCVYDGRLVLDKHEIETGEFMSIVQVKKHILKEKYTPVNTLIFNEYMKNYYNNDPAIKNI